MVPESHCLLRRQVDHDKPIGSCLLGILEHAILTILQDRVVVSHKQNRDLETPLAGRADHVQRRRDSDSIREGLGVGLLDRGAISNGVGEGNTQLDYICKVALWSVKSVAKIR